MSRTPTSDARRAGWMILGLLVVPVLSVTSTAIVADVASTTDPAAAAVGIPATLGGLLMGSLVFRLGRAAHSGTVALRAILRAVGIAFGPARPAPSRVILAGASVRPTLVLVPAQVGRRGPPVSLR